MPIHRRYETSGFTSLHEAGAPYGLPVILNKFLRIKILSITHLAAIFCRERPFIFTTGKKNDSGKRWLAVMLRGTLWLVLL